MAGGAAATLGRAAVVAIHPAGGRMVSGAYAARGGWATGGRRLDFPLHVVLRVGLGEHFIARERHPQLEPHQLVHLRRRRLGSVGGHGAKGWWAARGG